MTLSNLKNLASLAQAAQSSIDGKHVLKLNLNEVRPKPDQVRKAFNDIQALADSILQEGLIQPIIVSNRGTDGFYEIQKGERRWRACQLAGLSTIDAIVNEKAISNIDTIAGELIENIQRDDLTPMEIATALQQFTEEGWKQKAIAQRIGKTISFVSSHLSLLKLPEPVLGLYQQEITQDTETLNNLRLLYELNPQHCKQICASALVMGISRVSSREALNSVKKPKPEVTPETKQETSVNKQESDTKPTLSVADTTTDFPNTTVPDPLWISVKPAQLHMIVSVLLDGDNIQGQILTDRVDQDPTYVWVKLPAGQITRLSASQIKLEKLTLR